MCGIKNQDKEAWTELHTPLTRTSSHCSREFIETVFFQTKREVTKEKPLYSMSIPLIE